MPLVDVVSRSTFFSRLVQLPLGGKRAALTRSSRLRDVGRADPKVAMSPVTRTKPSPTSACRTARTDLFQAGLSPALVVDHCAQAASLLRPPRPGSAQAAVLVHEGDRLARYRQTCQFRLHRASSHSTSVADASGAHTVKSVMGRGGTSRCLCQTTNQASAGEEVCPTSTPSAPSTSKNHKSYTTSENLTRPCRGPVARRGPGHGSGRRRARRRHARAKPRVGGYPQSRPALPSIASPPVAG